ncbi:hypothetical protein FRC17_011156 [Serendipita sp. 399]|nr:hypothetical protein FRC17_011156 [Serendipita sp. 399]
MRTAHAWGGAEVASRVRFTDVAPKECNAHTIATDIIWSGTPLLTLPKEPYKMSSRVASSIAFATGFGDSMVVYDEHAYVERAVALANSISYRAEINELGEMERRGVGELMELRRNLILHRDRMPLFDTPRWTRNFEKGLEEIWHRWAESCRTPWSNLNDEGGVTITDGEPFFSEGPPV